MSFKNTPTQSTKELGSLPENYTRASTKSEVCGNCHFLVNKEFCNLWRSLIKTNHFCESWLGHNPTGTEIKERLYKKKLGEEQ